MDSASLGPTNRQPTISEIPTGTFLRSYWSASHLVLPDDNTVNEGPLGSDSVKRQWCIGHLTLASGHLTFFFFFFLNREIISGRWGKLSFPTEYEN